MQTVCCCPANPFSDKKVKSCFPTADADLLPRLIFGCGVSYSRHFTSKCLACDCSLILLWGFGGTGTTQDKRTGKSQSLEVCLCVGV